MTPLYKHWPVHEAGMHPDQVMQYEQRLVLQDQRTVVEFLHPQIRSCIAS